MTKASFLDEDATQSMGSQNNFFEKNDYLQKVEHKKKEKHEHVIRMQTVPMAVYDITAGLKKEEPGFGYKRSQFVISTKKNSYNPYANRNSKKQLISIESEETKKIEELDKVLELINKQQQRNPQTLAQSPLHKSIDVKSSLNNTKSTMDLRHDKERIETHETLMHDYMNVSGADRSFFKEDK